MDADDVTNTSSISFLQYPTLPHQATTPSRSRQKESCEVDDLKYRISQLEHLVITASLHNTTVSSSSNPNASRLTTHGLIERVSQLESLLAASELDNRRLNQEIELLNATQQKLKVNFLEKIREKDLVISDLQQNMELLAVKLSKSQKKLETIEEYVNTLPSQEELDEAKDCISRYETENNLLHDKVDRMTLQLNETQRDFIEKDMLYNNAMTKYVSKCKPDP